MIQISDNKIIISGHYNKEKCETFTLLANALSASPDFRQIKYENGYAEFEKVGRTDDLKFWLTVTIGFTINGITCGVRGTQIFAEEDSVSVQKFAGNLELEATLTKTGILVTNVGSLGSRVAVYEGEFFADGTTTHDLLPNENRLFKFADGYTLSAGNIGENIKNQAITLVQGGGGYES